MFVSAGAELQNPPRIRKSADQIVAQNAAFKGPQAREET